MVKPIEKLPALGQAWSGDWYARVHERLRMRGFESVTALVEAMPAAPLVVVAEELSTDRGAGVDRADVAAEQLLRIWREEAHKAGELAVQRFSRRMLVGELHRELSGGWRSDWTAPDPETQRSASSLASAIGGWISSHSEAHRPAADRVFKALLANGRAGKVPAGWLPANADDPLLVETFRRHWSEPE